MDKKRYGIELLSINSCGDDDDAVWMCFSFYRVNKFNWMTSFMAGNCTNILIRLFEEVDLNSVRRLNDPIKYTKLWTNAMGWCGWVFVFLFLFLSNAFFCYSLDSGKCWTKNTMNRKKKTLNICAVIDLRYKFRLLVFPHLPKIDIYCEFIWSWLAYARIRTHTHTSNRMFWINTKSWYWKTARKRTHQLCGCFYFLYSNIRVIPKECGTKFMNRNIYRICFFPQMCVCLLKAHQQKQKRAPSTRELTAKGNELIVCNALASIRNLVKSASASHMN